MKRITILASFLAIALATPQTLLACERCFGAGVDAPAVRALSASMLVLVVLMSGVFTGILTFFRNMSDRASAFAAERDDSTSD